jgi:hypothetical protein
MKQQQKNSFEPPSVLYHFTCRLWWHFIEREGISRGEVPLSPTHVLSHPNLTSNPEPTDQRWSRLSSTNKTAVRIAIEVPSGDDLLISWRALADTHGVERWWYRALDEAGAWEARNWWVYRGVLRPERFMRVDFLDDERISEFESERLTALQAGLILPDVELARQLPSLSMAG